MTPTPTDSRIEKDRPLPQGEGMFGRGMTWGGDAPPASESPKPAAAVVPAVAPTAGEQAEFKKWQESVGSKDRQEFEDWRAWQEWRKKNPK